jgi:ribonuclease Z
MKYFPKISSREYNGLRIEGTSVSAYGTALGFPDFNLCIDIGVCPYSFITYSNLVITHGHQDHLLELTRYVALRNMQKIDAPNIYVPHFLIDGVKTLLENWMKLESRGRHNFNLIPVVEGEKYNFHGNYWLEPFRVFHSIPTFGYKIFERRKKLKPEFHGLSGPEIVKLKKKGTEIENEVWIPLLLHTSDTGKKIFSEVDFTGFETVILECTFLLPEHRKTASDRKHLHIQEIVENLPELDNKQIILSHFSMRYPDAIIYPLVKEFIPDINRDRIFILGDDKNGRKNGVRQDG